MLSRYDSRIFEDSRPKLLGLAYRILGSLADAEDAVQDTFLKWANSVREEIDNPGSWLTTICTRRCLDLLRSAHRSRVNYIGSWLPEPIQKQIETEQENDVRLTIVNPTGLYDPAPNGYSHAIVAKGGTRIAYIAGQGGEDQSGSLSQKFADQVKQACANLRTALNAVGAEPHQVTKITTYVVEYDQSMLYVITQIVTEMFGSALPAQTLIPVPRLALDGMLFEIDAIAVLD